MRGGGIVHDRARGTAGLAGPERGKPSPGRSFVPKGEMMTECRKCWFEQMLHAGYEVETWPRNEGGAMAIEPQQRVLAMSAGAHWVGKLFAQRLEVDRVPSS